MVTKYRLYPCISQKQENKKKLKKEKKILSMYFKEQYEGYNF